MLPGSPRNADWVSALCTRYLNGIHSIFTILPTLETKNSLWKSLESNGVSCGNNDRMKHHYTYWGRVDWIRLQMNTWGSLKTVRKWMRRDHQSSPGMRPSEDRSVIQVGLPWPTSKRKGQMRKWIRLQMQHEANEQKIEPNLDSRQLNIKLCNPVSQLDLRGLWGEAPKPCFAESLYLKRESSKRVYHVTITRESPLIWATSKPKLSNELFTIPWKKTFPTS